MRAPEQVVLGHLGRAHGLKGELRFFPEDPASTLLAELDAVGVGERGRLQVARARPAGRFWIVSFEAIGDRSAAEDLENLVIWIERGELPETGAQHYLVDLVGCEVVDRGEQILGHISGIEVAGAQAHLIVDSPSGAWLLPAVEAFLIEVDLEAARVRVELPEGLVEAQQG